MVPSIIINNKRVIPFFIKGLFDSDGNIYLHRKKTAIQFRQKSQKFIIGVKDLLLEVGIHIGGPYYDKANNSWLLWSSKKSSVDRFIKDINFLNPMDP
ncbi:MAG: LAGLIDADG family homing endonuclease [Nanoarchaeota archaeon]|nr:LAGLIDADG family homing endonuclease [Nanoarchaeota archaeon]